MNKVVAGMPSQLTIEAALDETIRAVDANNALWVALARNEAKRLCLAQGSVTSDDLREWADRTGLQPDSSHAWGALFKAPGWAWIGRERSRYPSSNGRFVNRWVWEA